MVVFPLLLTYTLPRVDVFRILLPYTLRHPVCTRKTRILDVVYNASNNELVRTKTLVKNAIVLVSFFTKMVGQDAAR